MGAPGLTTSNKKATFGAPGVATNGATGADCPWRVPFRLSDLSRYLGPKLRSRSRSAWSEARCLLQSSAEAESSPKRSQEPLVASLLLVVRPGAPSSFLFLVVRPGAPSSTQRHAEETFKT